MVGIAVRAPAPVLRRAVRAGVRVVTAEGREEAGVWEGEPIAPAEGGPAGRRSALAAEGIGSLLGTAEATSGRRSAQPTVTAASEAQRRVARRELLVGRLRAVSSAAAERRGSAAARTTSVAVAQRAADAEFSHPRPISRRPPMLWGERGERRTAAYPLAPSLNREGESPVALTVTGAVARRELVVGAALPGGRGRNQRQDGLRGVRRGQFEAEEDLRLEFVR